MGTSFSVKFDFMTTSRCFNYCCAFKRGRSRQPGRQLDDDFIIYYTNSNHLPNKVSELSVLAVLKKLKIMCVTETHFKEEITDAEISIPNFVVHREDRCGNTKGGGRQFTHIILF